MAFTFAEDLIVEIATARTSGKLGYRAAIALCLRYRTAPRAIPSKVTLRLGASC